MKQLLKSYHVFLSYAWERWLLYLVYPLLFVLVNYAVVKRGMQPEVSMILCSSMIVSVELFFDFLVFGGVAAKDTNKLEYLKTSAKGLSILQRSIIGDGIRRFFSVTLIMMAYCIIDNEHFTPLRVLMCVFSALFMIELGLIVGRSFSYVGVVMAVIVFLGMLATPFTIIVLSNMIAGIICLILYVMVLVTGRVIIMRKARKSYYDGRD